MPCTGCSTSHCLWVISAHWQAACPPCPLTRAPCAVSRGVPTASRTTTSKCACRVASSLSVAMRTALAHVACRCAAYDSACAKVCMPNQLARLVHCVIVVTRRVLTIDDKPGAGAVSLSTSTIAGAQFFVIDISFEPSMFIPVLSKTVCASHASTSPRQPRCVAQHISVGRISQCLHDASYECSATLLKNKATLLFNCLSLRWHVPSRARWQQLQRDCTCKLQPSGCHLMHQPVDDQHFTSGVSFPDSQTVPTCRVLEHTCT